jgi:hypothetical protein
LTLQGSRQVRYVTEGTLTCRLDERDLEAPAGTFVHIPKGMVHTHWNARADMPPGPPDMRRVGEFYESYGLRVVGPPPSNER